MSVSGADVREGVEREDKVLRNKLLDKNFVNHDNHSRPCTPEYAEGWERIFGKKQERPDSVNIVTAPEKLPVYCECGLGEGDPGCPCAR